WAEIGQIKLSFGQASLERKGELIPAKVGLLVEAADVIITGKDGRLGITFTDDSRFAAGPNSRIELTTFKFNATTHEGEFVTKVDQGTLAVVSGNIAKHRPDAMRVRTPSSVLGVRGTKFLVKVAP
ncbi:MAG: hypothetical protein HN956_05945, partial [Rhodospirillaceae bacterium]|nr:hypothetical protein [Rhodospirillaceae bacterium]